MVQFDGDQMALIVFILVSIALLALVCQAILLLHVLLSTKQRWPYFLVFALVGIISIWSFQNFVQAQAQMRDNWNHLPPRGPLEAYRALFGVMDQALVFCFAQVAVLLALAAALYLLRRLIYSRITHPPIGDFVQSKLL